LLSVRQSVHRIRTFPRAKKMAGAELALAVTGLLSTAAFPLIARLRDRPQYYHLSEREPVCTRFLESWAMLSGTLEDLAGALPSLGRNPERREILKEVERVTKRFNELGDGLMKCGAVRRVVEDGVRRRERVGALEETGGRKRGLLEEEQQERVEKDVPDRRGRGLLAEAEVELADRPACADKYRRCDGYNCGGCEECDLWEMPWHVPELDMWRGEFLVHDCERREAARKRMEGQLIGENRRRMASRNPHRRRDPGEIYSRSRRAAAAAAAAAAPPLPPKAKPLRLLEYTACVY
jgi:hypothetical protein